LLAISYQLPAASYQLPAQPFQLEAGSWKLEAGSWKLTLSLFMFLIRADHAHHATTAHDLALIANPFD
jgi:hypothetical protein